MATFQLLAPVQVVVEPPLDEAEQLLWNGQALKADMTRLGTYRVKVRGITITPCPSQGCSFCCIILMRSIQATERGKTKQKFQRRSQEFLLKTLAP